jgi:hypothetical protein
MNCRKSKYTRIEIISREKQTERNREDDILKTCVCSSSCSSSSISSISSSILYFTCAYEHCPPDLFPSLPLSSFTPFLLE